MNKLSRATLFAGAAAIAFSPAFAQAQSASDDSNAGTVQDIVVTAQRREESLQKVPIAVTAANAATLASVNITSAMDIGKIAPTVQLEANNGAVQTFMRGVGTDFSPVGDEQSNALYIDGVYYVRLTPVLFQLNNIDRIEVLRGPQGTLFGRNATAGLIQVVTRDPKPGQHPEMNFEIGYGNYHTATASVYAATGLGDKVATDFSAFYSNQNKGWGTNTFTGQDVDKERTYAFRNKWVIEVSDSTRLTAAADYEYDNGDIGVTQRYYGPGAVSTSNGDGSGPVPAAGFYDRNENSPSFSSNRSYGGYARIEQDIGFARVTDTVAYRKLNQHFGLDNDFTSLSYNANLLPSFGKQFSNELQIASAAGSKINWIGGLYYLTSRQGYTPASFTGLDFGPPGTVLNAAASQKTTSIAGYAQATVPIIDKVHLTGGVRYTHDHVTAEGGIDAVIPGLGTIAAQPFQENSANFSKVTWKGVLDYQPINDVMLYASASRGFKSGVFNLLTYSPTPVKPEVLDAYELGFKSELLGHHLRLNGDVFYYNWHNPQVQIIPAPGTSALVNAGGAHIKGAEIDATAVVSKQLSFNAAVTYLDGKYTDFQNAPTYIANPVAPFGLINGPNIPNAAGYRLPHAPKLTGVVGMQYQMPVSDTSKVSFAVNYAYTSMFYWHVDQRNIQPHYGLLDASLAYSFADDSVTLKLWGSNLTNKKYYLHEYEIAGTPGDGGAPGAPRTYGVKLGYKFR